MSRYNREIPDDLNFWQQFLSRIYQVVLGSSPEVNIELAPTENQDSDPQFDMDVQGVALTTLFFYIQTPAPDGKPVIISYVPLAPSPESQHTANWDRKITVINDIPVMVIKNPRQQDRGVINGYYRSQTGEVMEVRVVIDLTTGETTSVWGLRDMILFEIIPQVGDTFEPIWMSFDEALGWNARPSGTQITFGETPLRVNVIDAPAGRYRGGIMAADVGGNRTRNTVLFRLDETGRFSNPPTTTPTPTASPTACLTLRGWRFTYTVQQGENLTMIAQRYGLSAYDLQIANCLPNANVIRPGQILLVPSGPTPVPFIEEATQRPRRTRTPAPTPTATLPIPG